MSDKKTIDDGGPAADPEWGDGTGSFEGVSRRDYFAAKALAGFCANPAVFAANGMSGWALVNTTPGDLAAYCLQLADALIAEGKVQP